MFFPITIYLSDQIENLLPQTQCRKCGYAGCRPYAQAIVAGHANYNQCPPGGAQGVARLANLLNKPLLPLNKNNGIERSRLRAVINESLCIGCTLCIQVCPVDAIIGATKQLHTVLEDFCTGCDLCVTACPVDCINLLEITPGKKGWDAWSQNQADVARKRYYFRSLRLNLEQEENNMKLIEKANINLKKLTLNEVLIKNTHLK